MLLPVSLAQEKVRMYVAIPELIVPQCTCLPSTLGHCCRERGDKDVWELLKK